MDNVVVTPTQLAYNTPSADLIITGGTAIDATKSNSVLYPQEGKTVVIIQNTFAGNKKVTVKAGAFLAAGQGDLEITIPQNDVFYFVPTSDRFKDADGKVMFTYEADMTGFIRAIYLP